jgi:hypothetical protein
MSRVIQVAAALLVVAGIALFVLHRTGALDVRWLPLVLIGAGLLLWRHGPRLIRPTR